MANDKNKNSKTWWTLLKSIYSNTDSSLSVPPLETNNKTIVDDKEKAEAFNTFFLEASQIDDSDAKLPLNHNITEHINSLSSIDIKRKDVQDQMQILNTNKAYGPDGLSPIFIKEGGKTMEEVLFGIFSVSLDQGIFPSAWKQANVIPLHKKESMAVVNNYRPVSLLCVASKVFERIVFKYVFNYFKDNFIINNYQSGFQAGRSTVTQLLELYHQFCQAVDNHKEVRVVFLDIHKAFDKVWHKGIVYKLKLCGVSGNLLKWFESYLKDRLQRVVLNGQFSSWEKIRAGVPQGSVLGPLLFLLYINDISSVVEYSNIRLFADDTCLFLEVGDRLDTAAKIESDLLCIDKWANNWLVSFAPKKTKSLTLSTKHDSNLNPTIRFKGHDVEEVQAHTYLGLIFTTKLSWNIHINNVEQKARKKLNMLIPLKFKLDRKSLEVMFMSFVSSSMYYAVEVWGGSYDSYLLRLEKVIVDGMRLVTGATARSNIAQLYVDTGWNSFAINRDEAVLKMMFKVKNGYVPSYLSELLPQENQYLYEHNLRRNHNLRIPFACMNILKMSFISIGIKLWNSLDQDIRQSVSIVDFKAKLRNSHKVINVLYYYGQRWPSVVHARLRIGCSKLNYDACFNLHLPDVEPACVCGAKYEDVNHFFMSCPNYNDIRRNLKQSVESVTNFDLKTVLHGNQELGVDENHVVFDAVHKFILESERFI